MKFNYPLLCLLFVSTFALGNTDAKNIENNLQKHSIVFSQNEGQWHSDIKYLGNTKNAQFLIGKNAVGFQFARNSQKKTGTRETMAWGIEFLGANSNSKIGTKNLLSSKSNYLLGKHDNWRTNINNYGTIIIENIYNNIDLEYYGTGEKLKYDYHVKPKGKLSDIKMKCSGIYGLSINSQGKLEIETEWGVLLEEIPFSYQEINGKTEAVNIEYILYDEFTFGFQTKEKYNVKQELIIDPVTLVWGTYIGGDSTSGGSNGYFNALTKDVSGNIYGTGMYALGFPTTPSAFDTSQNGGCGAPFGSCNGFLASPASRMDAFVFKLSADGSTLLYATYIGGTGDDFGYDISVNSTGEAYVTGMTTDPSITDTNNKTIFPFPVTPAAYDTSYNGGGQMFGDAFALQLNANGDALLFSTYLGGNAGDVGRRIALTNTNEVLLVGETNSTNGFDTTIGAYQGTNAGGFDAFIVKLDATGSTLQYSSLIGGPGDDFAFDVNINTNNTNEIIISGACSSGFPQTTAPHGPLGDKDAYIAKINPMGTGTGDLILSTVIGGTQQDIGAKFTQGVDELIYLTGTTRSADFPFSTGAFQATLSGPSDLMVTQLDLSTNILIYASAIGGTSSENILRFSFTAGFDNFPYDLGVAIELDENQDILFVGTTQSSNYPVTACTYQPTNLGVEQAVFSKISPKGTGTNDLIYSTYLGGSGTDYVTGFLYEKVGCDEILTFGLTTHSNDITTTVGAYQPNRENQTTPDQPALIQLSFNSKVNPDFIADTVCVNTPTTFTDITDQCGLLTPLQNWLWKFDDGDTSTAQHPQHIFSTPGSHSVKLITGCPKDSITLSVFLYANPAILTNPSDTICIISDSSILSASGGISYLWSPNTSLSNDTISNPVAYPNTNTTYQVVVTNINNCIDSALVNIVVLDTISSNVTSDTSICIGESMQLIASGGVIYSWEPTATLSDATINNPIASPINPTTYRVVASNKFCPNDTAYMSLNVNPLPAIIANEDSIINLGNSINLLATGGMTYVWSPSSSLNNNSLQNPIANPIQNTTYLVIGTDSNGCQNSDQVSITVEYKDVFIPNAFSPNGDGDNDVFHVRGEGVNNFLLKIYDRWGNLVFENILNNLGGVSLSGVEGWDGTGFNKGVYVYQLEVELINGENIFKTGNISLVR